jgi:hypothetical protein
MALTIICDSALIRFTQILNQEYILHMQKD